MSNVSEYIPAFQFGHKVYPENMVVSGLPLDTGNVWYVDGDKSTGGAGKTWADAYSTVGDAITAASAFDVILVKPKQITDYTGDPTSYEENLIIPFSKAHLSIIGVSRGRTQGGLPQFKDGATATDPILKIRAPGCYIANIGFNGSGNTGGGILFDDDYSTKSAFGTTIENCHFKNCKGATATNAATGGAIMWPAEGNAWQVNILNNKFYKNVGDIVVKGCTNTRPQDILIQGNLFQHSPTSSTDCNILCAIDGFQSVIIDSNVFGAEPALGSGSNTEYMDLTGTQSGMVTRNMFGCVTAEAETDVTFGAAGSAAYIPTTVFIAGNWGQSGATAAAADGAAGEVFRT